MEELQSFLSHFTTVAVGSTRSLLLSQSGKVYTTGNLSYSFQPEPLHFPYTVVAIACHTFTSYLITVDGDLYQYESNNEYIKVDLSLPALKVVADEFYGLVVLLDGTLVSTVVQETKVPAVIDVSMGLCHVMMVLADGTVGGYGANYDGQLGNGQITYQHHSAQVPTMTNLPVGLKVVKVACGSAHTILLLENGNVYGVGSRFCGRLGTSGMGRQSIPIKIPLPLKATAITCKGSSTLMLLEDGSVFGCGTNYNGELGTKTLDTQITPVKMILPSPAESITAGGHQILITLRDQQVYASGRKLDATFFGYLDRAVPAKVDLPLEMRCPKQ
jgi:alpha-tubulin suppressor-like RCC1 family protein